MLQISRADSPLVLGLPHTGTEIPAGCLAALNDTGRAMADTDWHIHDLYADLTEATTVRTLIHRYVIDANRDPTGTSLYPGQNTTGLCPLTDFNGIAIYHPENEPDTAEIERRRVTYHAPYHAALQAELDRVKAIHGFAILYDCHSIRSFIPFLFDGVLPDFNIGTNNGITCDPSIERAIFEAVKAVPGHTAILNGRFKGGWTTRHYGQPGQGVQAIQMELAQSTYMQEYPDWSYDTTKADILRTHLKTILDTLSTWRPR